MVQDKPLRTSWQRKMKDRQERKLAKDFARHLEEERERRRQEKKRRRAENLKRRLENERKAEVVQVVSVALLRGPEPWPSGALHPRCLCTPASQPPASHCDPRPLMGSLPLPREQSRDYSPSNAPSHTTPRSETLPSSSGQRRSSFAPLRSGIPWPCCRSSHPRVQQPRSELRTAQRPSVAKHRI